MANDVLSLLGCLSASAGRSKTVRLLYHLAHFYAWYLAAPMAAQPPLQHAALSKNIQPSAYLSSKFFLMSSSASTASPEGKQFAIFVTWLFLARQWAQSISTAAPLASWVLLAAPWISAASGRQFNLFGIFNKTFKFYVFVNYMAYLYCTNINKYPRH